jgi:beta-hydroxyacyl-ACP dehydratase FabZ
MKSERAERPARSDHGKPVELPLEYPDVVRRLPHRYPFLFIDRVIEFEDGKRLAAVKNVTANEPYFTGHFPGRPIVPGVIICEALVQAGGILASLTHEGLPTGRGVVLAGLEHVRFRRMVVPGDQLRLDVELLNKRRALWKMHGRASVDGQTAAECDFLTIEISETLPGW